MCDELEHIKMSQEYACRRDSVMSCDRCNKALTRDEHRESVGGRYAYKRTPLI